MWSKKIRAINHLGGKCKKCGNDNIFNLCFHHRNTNNKDFCISEIKLLRWSTILKEIEKCDLLCCNCHKEVHHSDDVKVDESYRINKNIFLDYKNSKCAKCSYDKNPASLHFHHRNKDQKLFDISSFSKRIKKIEDLDNYIISELDKCEILCNNCHVEEHIDKERFEKLKDKIYKKVNDYKEIQGKINREIVYELYDNGMKKVEIAKYFNSAKSTITNIIKNR